MPEHVFSTLHGLKSVHRASVVSMHIQTCNGSHRSHSLIVSRCYTFYMHGLGTVLVFIVDEGSLALSYAHIHFHVLFMYVLVSSPFNPSFPPPPIQTMLLYVWWEAPPLTVVVWKCSTMECGVQCVMTPGTSMMPL